MSSAWITGNGVEVASPSNFNQTRRGPGLDKGVTLSLTSFGETAFPSEKQPDLGKDEAGKPLATAAHESGAWITPFSTRYAAMPSAAVRCSSGPQCP